MFLPFISQAVIDEIEEGDRNAANDRLDAVDEIPLLEKTDDIARLTDILLWAKCLPEKSQVDAEHIAYAAVHQMECLITWNQKHLANADTKDRKTSSRYAPSDQPSRFQADRNVL